MRHSIDSPRARENFVRSMEPPVNLESLPATVRTLAEVIGTELALRLVESCPHRKHRCAYIPATISDEHWIVKAVGREAADLLADTFGGELLTVANCAALRREERNREIQDHLARGESVASMAQRFGLTTARVLQIIAGDYGPLRITGRNARKLPPLRTRAEQLQLSIS